MAKKSYGIMELLEALLKKPMLTRKDVAYRYGKSVETIDEWRRLKKIPQPYPDPNGRPMWRLFDLMFWEMNK